MATNHSANADVSALRDSLNDFIFDTLYGSRTSGDKAFDSKLGQVLNFHRTDCDRRLAGDTGSANWFLRVRVNQLMAMRLTTQALKKRADRLDAGQPSTPDEWAELRYLTSALEDFRNSGLELSQRFSEPDLSNLASRFWFGFYNTTAEEVRHDAESIRAMFEAAREVAA